jgi:hypothetical protein
MWVKVSQVSDVAYGPFVFFLSFSSSYVLLAEIIKSGGKVVTKTDERSKIEFLGTFVYFFLNHILLLKLYEVFDRSFY